MTGILCITWRSSMKTYIRRVESDTFFRTRVYRRIYIICNALDSEHVSKRENREQKMR